MLAVANLKLFTNSKSISNVNEYDSYWHNMEYLPSLVVARKIIFGCKAQHYIRISEAERNALEIEPQKHKFYHIHRHNDSA
jgi:hypothetical protein